MHEVYEEFKSISQMLEVLNRRPHNTTSETDNSSNSDDYEFTGTHSYEEAENLIVNGDKKLYEKIKDRLKVSRDIKTDILPKRQIKNDIIGYAPNVPNAIMGLPNSMINIEKKPMKSKTVSILYSPTENCYISKEEFIKSGVAVLNVINSLELSGYRCNLKVFLFNGENLMSGEDREIFRCALQVKDYREHLDLLKIAFPFANASLLRRFGFRALETNPNIEHFWGCSYGRDFSKLEYEFDGVYLNLTKTKLADYDTDKILKKYFSKYVK